jgi:hypothetical protein
MVILYTDARAAGVADVVVIQAVYATLDDAQAQAEHDLMTGRTPLRIEDGETGEVLWVPSPSLP